MSDTPNVMVHLGDSGPGVLIDKAAHDAISVLALCRVTTFTVMTVTFEHSGIIVPVHPGDNVTDVVARHRHLRNRGVKRVPARPVAGRHRASGPPQ